MRKQQGCKFSGLLLMLGLALALTAVFVSCKNPTGPGSDSGIDSGGGGGGDGGGDGGGTGGGGTKYTVSFYDGETEYEDFKEEVPAGGKVTEKKPEEKDGYVFIAWYTEEEWQKEWIFARDTVNKDIELYARFSHTENDKVTVSFDLKGGMYDGDSNMEPVDLSKGQPVTEPDAEKMTYTNPKYSFARWYIDDPSTPWDFTTRVEESFTLNAHWSEPYEVDFDVNGGNTPAPETQKVKPNGLVEKPTDPTYTNPLHRFLGWFPNSETTTPAWDFTTQKVTANMTLTARWIRQYNVTFNPNGGTFASGDNTTGNRTVPVDENVPLTAENLSPRAGWDFDGWQKQGTNENWNFENDLVTQDITLTAQWTQLHTITFNGNGGTLSNGDSEKPVEVRDGDKVADPSNDFTYLGEKPVSWHNATSSTDLNESNKWDFANALVFSDITLYAKYPALYKVTFLTGKLAPDPSSKVVDVYEGKFIDKNAAPKDNEIGAAASFKNGTWIHVETGKPWNFTTDKVQGNMSLRPDWEFTEGGEGPSGGMIFYYDPDGFDFYLGAGSEYVTAHYLEIYPVDLPGTYKWQTGADSNTVTTVQSEGSRAVGRGKQNTALIRAVIGTGAPFPAANAAYEIQGDGSWFLPSASELDKAYAALIPKTGGEDPKYPGFDGFEVPGAVRYWTSNLGGYGNAYSQSFAEGQGAATADTPASSSYHVRPIRAW